ncbi:hypothetical protein LTS02_016733 [Friedmanniomyces endolithicus]|nr:hypothetical protein LTS02_016733 [Friedmanniomyces endolithicus]
MTVTDEHSRKKPQRVQLACLPCRQAKLSPACDHCIKRSREADCSYTERGLRYNAAKQKAESMREKVDRLESFVNELKQNAPAGKPGKAVLSGHPDEHIKEHASNEVLAQATGKLRLTDTGGVHFVGPSHWESIIEDIAEVKAYFDLQGSPVCLLDDESPPLLESNVIDPELRTGRYGLEFTHLKATCVLYQRYLALPGIADERKRCVDAARALIEHQVVLLRATEAGGELVAALPFVLQYIHDFNLAAMLLCSHANRQRTSSLDLGGDGAETVLRLVLDVGRRWERCGVNSTMARHALRTILRFVEQRVGFPHPHPDIAGSGEVESGSDQPSFVVNTEERSVAGRMAERAPPGFTPIGQNEPAAEYDSVPYYASFAAANPDQDVLFRELFGPGYTTQGDMALDET